MHRLRRRAQRNERGATVVVVALVLSGLLLVTAFAVDIGMQRVVRSDMQAVADVAALDLARHLDGGTVSSYSTSEFDTALAQSLARNADHVGDSMPVVSCPIAGSVSAGACWQFVTKSGSDWVVAGASAVPDGVRVYARTETDFAFGGVTGVAAGGSTRRAVASADNEACFRLGSYALRLDSQSSVLLNAVLGGFLGGTVSLNALSYQGLANADIGLLDIAAELGLGSVDELLSSNVSAADFLVAAAHVLSGDGDTASANVLNAIAAKVGAHAISVGNLVSAQSGSQAAETATINAFDLLTGTVFLADGTNAVSIPSLGTNLGLTGTALSTSLKIIEKPRMGCGKKSAATADTSQVALDISGTLASPGSALGLPLTATTALSASVAPAHGVLTDVICGSGTAADPSGEDVLVTSGVASASASVHVSVNASTSDSSNVGGLIGGITSLLNLLGLNKVASITVSGSVDLSAGTSAPSTPHTAQVRVPNNPATWDDPVSTGSGDLGLNTLSVSKLNSTLTVTAKNFLGLNVSLSTSQASAILDNLVTAVVNQVLSPLLTKVNDQLLSPIFDLLGISVGGADVFGQEPVCGFPTLVD